MNDKLENNNNIADNVYVNDVLNNIISASYNWIAPVTQRLIANGIYQKLSDAKNGITRDDIKAIIQEATIEIKEANINTDDICNILAEALAEAGLITIDGTTIRASEILYTTSNNSNITLTKIDSITNNTFVQVKEDGASIMLHGNGAKIHQNDRGITISVTGTNSSAGFYVGTKK